MNGKHNRRHSHRGAWRRFWVVLAVYSALNTGLGWGKEPLTSGGNANSAATDEHPTLSAILSMRGNSFEKAGKNYLALRDYGRALMLMPDDDKTRRAVWEMEARIKPAGIVPNAEYTQVVEDNESHWRMMIEDPWLGGGALRLLSKSRQQDGYGKYIEAVLDKPGSGSTVILNVADIPWFAFNPDAVGIPSRVDVFSLKALFLEMPDFTNNDEQKDLNGIAKQLLSDIVRKRLPTASAAKVEIYPFVLATNMHPARQIYCEIILPPGDRPWSVNIADQVTVKFAFHLIALPAGQVELFVLEADAKVFPQRLRELNRMLATLTFLP